MSKIGKYLKEEEFEAFWKPREKKQNANVSQAIKKYPELSKLARELAHDLVKEINQKAPKIKSEMPYREQFVLEEIIELLKKWV